MNKRGQIYILAALILGLVLYLLMTKTNIIYEHEIVDDFDTLSRNYEIEASKFMNNLLSDSTATSEYIKDSFNDFTCKFTGYARNQNPSFSLIYVFEYSGTVYIGNYLDNQPIVIEDDSVLGSCIDGAVGGYEVNGMGGGGGQNICTGCIEDMPTPNNLKLKITIGFVPYIITITEDRPEIVIVSREEKGEQRKVYTKKGFVGGGKKNEAVSISVVCGELEKSNIKEDQNKFDSYMGSGICISTGAANCVIYGKSVDGCMNDVNCCWGDVSKECEQGVCAT